MFRRIRTFGTIDSSDGTRYVARAYADPNADGTWSGWLTFFPILGGPPAATDRQATKADLAMLIDWADGLSNGDLQAALARARTLQRASLLDDEIARLGELEQQALADAGALEDAAESEIRAATLDQEAAKDARAEAEDIHRKRHHLSE